MTRKIPYLIAAIAGLFNLLPQSAIAKDGDRPNILFIIADDQSPFDLKTYDPNSPLDTPVLDQLSAEGMTFDAAHHMGSFSGAVCMPSRHMVMTGRTLWHLPPRNNKSGKGHRIDIKHLQRYPRNQPYAMAALLKIKRRRPD